MRVLLLHNRYRALGGEERTVSDIRELLTKRGHTVDLLERSSAATGRVEAARGLLAGGIDADEVAGAVQRMRADVVHAQNLHPLFGWRSLAVAKAAGARTVLHVQNFRLFCAIGVAYRDGAICHRCRGRDTRAGIRLGCRGSFAEAAVYAAGLALQQPRLFDHTDQFVAPSRAHAARLHDLGLPRGTTTSLMHFISDYRFSARSTAAEGRHALVAGRLVEEKGVDTAILAARSADVPLVIAGTGPDEPRLRELAAGGDVRFTGLLSQAELGELRRHAAVALVPSRWEEPAGYAVLDAFADGVPVLASDRGGLPELVGRQAVLDAEDVDAWSRALRDLWENPARREELGTSVLRRAREQLGEDRYYQALMRVYSGD